MKKALATDVTSRVWRHRITLGQEPVKLMNEAVLVEMNNPFVNIAINMQPVVTSNRSELIILSSVENKWLEAAGGYLIIANPPEGYPGYGVKNAMR